MNINTLLDIPINIASRYPNRVSHRYKTDSGLIDKTYREFSRDIRSLALGFYNIGIEAEDHVAFYVNNRYEWSLTDYALQSISAITVPRGSDTTGKEAEFIFNHSESKWLILENSNQIKDHQTICQLAKGVILVDKGEVPLGIKDKTLFLEDLIRDGELLDLERPGLYSSLVEKVKSDSTVSIIYTSGTTGNPKGVVLTQKNFTENVKMTGYRMGIDIEAGEVTVTVLPAWHAFERTFEYAGMSYGISFVYSSIRTFGQDILREKPHIIASVPRLWDSIYTKLKAYLKSQPKFRRNLFYSLVSINSRYKKMWYYLRKSYVRFKKELLIKKIYRTIGCIVGIPLLFLPHLFAEKVFSSVREKVGGRLRCAISGGGSLPVAVDHFFQSVGIRILNAYGMTECSPGIASRTIGRNSLGTIGTPFKGTQCKILDNEKRIVNRGEKGTLYVKGLQVMKEYYKNPEATKEVLDSDGWLCTGDLARETFYGEIVLVGRSKDTIVLLGGENVDPLPIEDKLQESDFVDHAMLLGQDKKGLTAFIAVNPETLSEFADSLKIKVSQIFKPDKNTNEPSKEYRELEKIVKADLDKKISKEEGFKPFEKITKVILVKNTFKVGQELTQTLKIKRNQIKEKYKELISKFLS